MQPYIIQLQQDDAKSLYAKQGITYLGLDLSDIQSDLENILGKKVDLVLRSGIKKQLLPYIQKDLTTIYEEN
ncbi:MAG: hypothetical protein UW22_C0054G0016 [Candidatus Gottesmanbacteria bacterium GW2011_GWB1_44_11c]|uniref:Uncharacterized protein n=1 Tax=Candidatus Gottesmanbacteria bacterium GW2011_GWB1_44_11c TaxID=1618447 RepID=A0A0G1JJ41_9BACT|nr:MAG: hypothetical protein UW22_C0054G0016 [Candidatus Gottesmanbacteria bacterium GW2011_GWB1_44_11c]